MRSLSTSRVPESRARTRRTVSPADPPGPATTTASGASGPSARSIAASASSTSTAPSTGTPAARSACAFPAGNGFTMSKTRNSAKATASTGSVSGSARTDSVMPATSSITMAPGSLPPSARSACSAAHVPIRVTATKKRTRPARENGTSHSRSAVSALATVPGATGAHPAPPTVAMTSATRVVVETGRLHPLADELVAFHLGDARAREVPRREGGAVAEIDDAVDLGRLAGRAALPRDRRVRARPVHERVDDGAHGPGVALPRDPVLNVLDDGRTLGGELRVDLIGIVGRRRAGFGRVREHAEPVEAGVREEREELLDRGRRLAREADEHGGAQRDVGDGRAELADDLRHAPRGDRAPHRAQHAVVAVLHGHVHVRHDPRARELVEQALVDVRGMQVHRADPRHPRVLAERQQQVADVAVARQVAPVGQRVLGDEDRLLHAALREVVDFRDDVVQRAAAVLAPELRNRAEGAAHVAALGDLHIGVRDLRREQPRGGGVVEVAGWRRRRPVLAVGGLADEVDDALEAGGAQDRVDFRHLPEDLTAVALGEAAGDDQGAAHAALLEPGEGEDRVHRLLARAVDERARVHDEALGLLGALDDRMAGGGQAPEHQLGVDLVLGTAQRGEVDLHRVRRLSKLIAIPKSFSRTSFITACRSSRLLPEMRTLSSWMETWTLILLSFTRRTISLALSIGMPCWSAIFWRSWLPEACSTVPYVRPLSGMPRLCSLLCKISVTALSFMSSGESSTMSVLSSVTSFLVPLRS